MLCEHCGAELRRWDRPSALTGLDSRLGRSTVGRRLLDILWRRGQKEPVRRDVLMQLIYGSVPNAPCPDIVRNQVYQLRRRLRGSGVEIVTADEGWRLIVPAGNLERADTAPCLEASIDPVCQHLIGLSIDDPAA